MPEGTYVVTAVDEESAVLRDVDTGQVHTLSDPSDLEEGEVLEATIEAEPPLEVTHAIEEVEDRWTVDLVRSEMTPTTLAEDMAADADIGAVVRHERAGEGEVHVLAVEPGQADDAAADVLDDEETLARAARLGVGRVEVRTGDALVSVRYLP
jgi:hypothetical protein